MTRIELTLFRYTYLLKKVTEIVLQNEYDTKTLTVGCLGHESFA